MRTRAHEMFQANPGLARNSTALFDMLGSLDHGIAGMQHQSIAFAKHGMVEKVYEMAEYLKVFQNPSAASAEDYKKLKTYWTGNTPDRYKTRAGDALDFILEQSNRLSLAKKYDPNVAKFLKHETGALIGGKDFDFPSMIEYHMREKGIVDERLTQNALSALDQTYGQMMGKFRGEGTPTRMNQFVSDLIDPGMSDPLKKAIDKRYGNTIAKAMPKFKSMGKGAGMAALGYLAFNFFRPNQLSGGMMDGYVDLGTDIHGSVNAINSDLQLPRTSPLDMVNASFSKKAFIEMNNISTDSKKGRSSYINELMKMNVTSKQYAEFKSRGAPRTNYTSFLTNYGKFNSRDHKRRSGMVLR
jgi:hypothetical protein